MPTTLFEKLKKPRNADAVRIPSLQLRGEAATRFTAIAKAAGLTVTKTAQMLLEHTLEADPSLRKALTAGHETADKKVQQPAPSPVLKEVKHA